MNPHCRSPTTNILFEPQPPPYRVTSPHRAMDIEYSSTNLGEAKVLARPGTAQAIALIKPGSVPAKVSQRLGREQAKTLYRQDTDQAEVHRSHIKAKAMVFTSQCMNHMKTVA